MSEENGECGGSYMAGFLFVTHLVSFLLGVFVEFESRVTRTMHGSIDR